MENISFDMRTGEILCIIGEFGQESPSPQTQSWACCHRPSERSEAIRFKGQYLEAGEYVSGAARPCCFDHLPGSAFALNPLMTVGAQIAEVMEVHNVGTPETAAKAVLDLLDEVGLPDPVADAAPISFSAVRRTATACDDRDGPGSWSGCPDCR